MQSSFKFSWHFELIKSRTLVLKMDLSFLSLDQKYVGQKYGEISGKCSLHILCFKKNVYYKHGKPPRSYVWPGRELFRLGNPLIISVPPTWMGLSSSSTLDSNWTLSLMKRIGKGFTLNRRNVISVSSYIFPNPHNREI